jgi:PST family polysaccharide transporter
MKNLLLANETRKRLFENFLSLSVLQAASYILPLITIPYLVRILGPEKFGLIAFSQAFVGYFRILTDYGFNLSATREISINRDDKNKVSEIFSSVMIIKFSLLLISLVLMSVVVFSFEKFRQDWLIYYFTFGIVAGQTLFPVWLFQGMERMKYIAFLNILSRLVFTVAIFVLIRHASDYLYVPLLNSLGAIIAGLLAMWVVFRDFKVEVKIPKLEKLKIRLKDGWYLFISQINIALFNNTNIVILGLLTNNTIVGYYSSAEKLIRAIMSIQIPVINSIYPYMAKSIKDNISKATDFAKRLLTHGTLIGLIIIILCWLLSKKLIFIIFGSNYVHSIIIFDIMLIIPLTVFINNIYGTQFLINLGYGNKFSKVLFISGILNLILCSALTYFFSYIGTAVSWVLTELVVLYGMYFYTVKYIPALKLKYIFARR